MIYLHGGQNRHDRLNIFVSCSMPQYDIKETLFPIVAVIHTFELEPGLNIFFRLLSLFSGNQHIYHSDGCLLNNNRMCISIVAVSVK